jgi:serine/threonine-protein phosphatase 2A activator
VKTGLFAEHSNQLWNISAVPSWTKINGGLIKMYKAEVSVAFTQFQICFHLVSIIIIPLHPVRRWQSGSEVTENRTMNCKLQLLKKFHIKSNLIKLVDCKDSK